MDLQPSDIVFLAIVIWLALEISGGPGGGLHSRVPARATYPR
jgi:hypothetical protein